MKLTDTTAARDRLARDQLLDRCIAQGRLCPPLSARETAEHIEHAIGDVPRDVMNAALWELGFAEEI